MPQLLLAFGVWLLLGQGWGLPSLLQPHSWGIGGQQQGQGWGQGWEQGWAPEQKEPLFPPSPKEVGVSEQQAGNPPPCGSRESGCVQQGGLNPLGRVCFLVCFQVVGQRKILGGSWAAEAC